MKAKARLRLRLRGRWKAESEREGKAAHLEGRGSHTLRRLHRKVDLLDGAEDLVDLPQGWGGCGGGVC